MGTLFNINTPLTTPMDTFCSFLPIRTAGPQRNISIENSE